MTFVILMRHVLLRFSVFNDQLLRSLLSYVH